MIKRSTIHAYPLLHILEIKEATLIQNYTYLDLLSTFGVGGAHPGGLNLTRKIFESENIHNSSKVLDVGCGTGQTAAYLAFKYGANVTGIDNNRTMVLKAKRRIEKNKLPVKIMQGSVEKTSLPDDHFDFIISESVLSFVNKPRALKEIFRLLKYGGRFIAIEQTINKKLTEKEENEIKQFYGFDCLNTKKDWMALLKQAGFQHIRIQKSTSFDSEPDYHFSDYIDPKFYDMMETHLDITSKYFGVLDYRIYLCTK